jgi:hypothetical protein
MYFYLHMYVYMQCGLHTNCMLQIVGAVTTYLVILLQFQFSLPNPHQNEGASNGNGTA